MAKKKEMKEMKEMKSMKTTKAKKGAGSWIAHVKKVAKQKKISYKEALKVASKTYKKK